MPLRALLADVLPELAPAQELDELGAEKHTHQQRRGAGDQHPARGRSRDYSQRRHQSRLAVNAEHTASSPTPREPLTSTTSPGLTSSRTIDAASVAVATRWLSPSNASPIAAASGPTVINRSMPSWAAWRPVSTW